MMAGDADVLTLGEALVSFRTDGIRPGWTATAHLAGAESNVAIGLARQGCRARWVGRVSDDALGWWILDTLRDEGVDVSHVVRVVEPAGVMVLEAPIDHARRVTYVRRHSAGSTLSAGDAVAALSGCRWVHLTGVTLALSDSARDACIEVARRAADAGVPVSLDVNHRPALWTQDEARSTLAAVLPHVDTVIASEEELPLLDRSPEAQAVERLLAGGRTVVVKRGERGASAWRGDEEVHLPAREVQVVDVIGAGDALCAGFLAGRLSGEDLASALQRGVDAAAACVASRGDWEGLPLRG